MENNKDQDNYRNEIYSKSVRAGKRTYFFDVKATRSGDHYLTITESKKKFDQDGNFHFEKHKIFLYKEDFDKFKDGLTDVVDKINTLAIRIRIKDGAAAASNKSSDAYIYAVVANVSKLNGLRIKVIGSSLTISREIKIATNKTEFLK